MSTPSTSRSKRRTRRGPGAAARSRSSAAAAVTAAPGRGGCASTSPSRRVGHLEVERVGPVAAGGLGVLVDLHEEGVDAHRRRRPGQRRHELPLAAGGVAAAAGELDRVGGVEADRHAQLAHACTRRAHVHHQVAVAEGGAALGERARWRLPASRHLRQHVAHVARGQELALLHVHAPAVPGAGHHQVGLAAEEGRDLEHVHHPPGGLGLASLVDVGEAGEPGGSRFTASKTAQAGLQAHAAEALAGWCGWPCRSRP